MQLNQNPKETDPFLLVGNNGQLYIRKMLVKEPPSNVITHINNLVNEKNKSSVLNEVEPLIKALNLSKYDINITMLQAFSMQLIKFLEKEPHKTSLVLQKLLPFVEINELNSLILQLLESSHTDLDEQICSIITKNKQLYEKISIKIKRKLFLIDNGLFNDFVNKNIDDYLEDEEIFIDNLNIYKSEEGLITSFSSSEVRNKKKNYSIKNLTEAIQDDIILYSIFNDIIYNKYKSTKDNRLGLLKIETTMQLHENNYKKSCESDNTYLLIWTLFVCVKENELNDRRIKTINNYTVAKHRDSKTFALICIVLNAPIIMNWFAKTAFEHVLICIQSNNDFKNDRQLCWINTLLNISINAPHIVENEITIFTNNSRDSFLNVYNVFKEIYYFDQKIISQNTPFDFTLDSNKTSPFETILNGSTMFHRKMVSFYVLYTISNRSYIRLKQYLQTILKSTISNTNPLSATSSLTNKNKVVLNEEYLEFIHSMISIFKENEQLTIDLCTDPVLFRIVMSDFLLTLAMKIESVYYEFVRILEHFQNIAIRRINTTNNDKNPAIIDDFILKVIKMYVEWSNTIARFGYVEKTSTTTTNRYSKFIPLIINKFEKMIVKSNEGPPEFRLNELTAPYVVQFINNNKK